MTKGLSAVLSLAVVGVVGFISPLTADGLPGEYLITDRWRDYRAASSMLSNPSYLAQKDYLTLRTATAFIMGSTFTLFHCDAAVPLPLGRYLRHAAGLSYAGATGKIDRYFFGAGDIPVSSGRQGYSNSSLTLGYGFSLLNYPVLSLFQGGANFNYLHQSNFDLPMNDFSLDLGVSIVADSSWRVGKQRIGVSWLNLAHTTEKYDQPLYTPNFRISWWGEYRLPWWGINACGGIDYVKKNISLNFRENRLTRSFREDDISLRIGMIDLFRFYSVFALFGSGYGGLSVHFSMPWKKIPLLGGGTQMLMSENTWPPTTTIYLDADIVARDTLWRLSAMPNRLYNEAMKLYSMGMEQCDQLDAKRYFWKAYEKYCELMTHFPNFSLNRGEVQFYSAHCLEELGMRRQAVIRYREAMAKCSTNGDCREAHFIAKAQTGLLRIDYRRGDFAEMMELYKNLNDTGLGRGTVIDSLQKIGDYYRGEAFFKNGNYDSACKALSTVPALHPLNSYARYTQAVAQYRPSCQGIGDTSKICNKGKEFAIELLKNFACDSIGPELTAITARCNLMAARVFYETGQMQEAVKRLRCIPTDSRYYEDALECFAWVFLKSKDWSLCAKAAKNLRETTKDSVLLCQAALLEAAALLKQDTAKNDTVALNLLRTVELISDSLRLVDSMTLSLQYAKRENLYRKIDTLGVMFDTTARAYIQGHYVNGDITDRCVLQGSQRDKLIDSLSKLFNDLNRQLSDEMEKCDLLTKWYCDAKQIDSLKIIIPMTINKIEIRRLRNSENQPNRELSPPTQRPVEEPRNGDVETNARRRR